MSLFKNYVFILAAFCSVLFFSCGSDDEGGSDDEMPTDTTVVDTPVVVVPQNKIVLIEEFSGVQCTNCPKGAEKVASILEQYPNQVIALNFHPFDPLCEPIEGESTKDFRTQTAENLRTAFSVNGLPAAMINRAPNDFGDIPSYNYSQDWQKRVEDNLGQTTKINLTVLPHETLGNYYTTTLNFIEDVAENLRISAYLVENAITNAQLLPDGSIDTNYIHKHVVSYEFTEEGGQLVGESNTIKQAGSEVKTFVVMPANEAIVVSSLDVDIVVILFYDDGENKEIIQVAKTAF